MSNHLHTVTITGADDAVDVQRLIELSQAFPFVEWGILRSAKYPKPPERYPSWQWLERLETAKRQLYPLPESIVRLSTHVCGRWARELMSGDLSKRIEIGTSRGRRVQLNGWSQYKLPGLLLASHARINGWREDVIAQATSLADYQRTFEFIQDHGYTNVHVLLDPSGGRGFESSIPVQWIDGGPSCGYAGGIGPHNVREVLDRLGGRFGWIDMESGVRDGHDRFQLDKVVSVLEQCRPYVAEAVP